MLLIYKKYKITNYIFTNNNKCVIIVIRKEIGDDFMAKVIVNFKMEEELKNKFDCICEDLGVTATSAYTMFATQVVRQGKIPFEITMEKGKPDYALYHNNKEIGTVEEARPGDSAIIMEYLKRLIDSQSKES